MGTIKCNPPSELPEKGVTDILFDIWKEELEAYLIQDDRMAVFMTNGAYSIWEAFADNPDRIASPAGGDDITFLPARRTDLTTFLSIVANACGNIHNEVILQKSTSLEWIYKKILEDYDIKPKKLTLFNLFDLQYQPEVSVVDFYNNYRNIVIANLRKCGDIICWKKSYIMEADEELSPTFEDMILANVLCLIDRRLPGQVMDTYHHLLKSNESFMDYRTDILENVALFLVKLEDNLSAHLHSYTDQLEK